jgi:hypothetical protein
LLYQKLNGNDYCTVIADAVGPDVNGGRYSRTIFIYSNKINLAFWCPRRESHAIIETP